MSEQNILEFLECPLCRELITIQDITSDGTMCSNNHRWIKCDKLLKCVDINTIPAPKKWRRKVALVQPIRNIYRTSGLSDDEKYFYRFLLEIVATNKVKTILDVACGEGKFFNHFSFNAEYWGIDPLLETSAFKSCNATLEQIPFPDESFDLIYLKDSLNYIYDIRLSMEKSYHKLKKGGVFVISEIGFKPDLEFMDYFKHILKKIIHPIHSTWDISYYQLQTSNSIQEVAEKYFDDLKIVYKKDFNRTTLIYSKK